MRRFIEEMKKNIVLLTGDNVSTFVVGNIRCYLDEEKITSVLLDRDVKLLRTKHLGYVPLYTFPKQIESASDIMGVKFICNKIINLEDEGIASFYGKESYSLYKLVKSFPKGDIILPDSEGVEDLVIEPYVDERSVREKEEERNPNVKKLIKKYYIDVK